MILNILCLQKLLRKNSLPMPLLLQSPTSVDNYYPTYLDVPSLNMMQSVHASYPVVSLLAQTMEKVIPRPVSMMKSTSFP